MRSKRRLGVPASRSNTRLDFDEPITAITLLDEEIRECYLKVIDTSDRSIVSVIAVLSPSNKVAGADGLKSFQKQRNRVMRSRSPLG